MASSLADLFIFKYIQVNSMSPKIICRAVRTVYGLTFADLSPDLLLLVGVSWPAHGVFLDLLSPSAFAYEAWLAPFGGSTWYIVYVPRGEPRHRRHSIVYVPRG